MNKSSDIDWDTEVGYWLDNVPYIWDADKDWKLCKRRYILNSDTKKITHVVYHDHGYLNGAFSRCKKISGYFKILYYNVDNFTFHDRDIRINGTRVFFPYLGLNINSFYDYLGIPQPNNKKIQEWNLHLVSVKKQNIKIRLPDVSPQKKDLRLKESTFLFSMMWYLKYSSKNMNICTPIGTIKNLENQSRTAGVFSILVYLKEGGQISLIYIDDNIINIVVECSKNKKIKYILLPVALQYTWSNKAHANLLLIDLKNYNQDKSRNVYLFDPWGKGEFDMSHVIYPIMTRLKFRSKDWKIHTPEMWCPKMSFQMLEYKRTNSEEHNYPGYCQIWVFWFMDVLMHNPDVPLNELVRIAHSQLSEKNPQFMKFIRNYAISMEKYVDEEKKRLKLTYDTPSYKLKTPDRKILGEHVDNIRKQYLERLKEK